MMTGKNRKRKHKHRSAQVASPTENDSEPPVLDDCATSPSPSSSSPPPPKKLRATSPPPSSSSSPPPKKLRATSPPPSSSSPPPPKKLRATSPPPPSSSSSFLPPPKKLRAPLVERFDQLGLSSALLSSLRQQSFEVMTPIQQRAIPALLAGQDVLACAKTGSGKTLAFLLPSLQRLIENGLRPELGAAAIFISPTRELALQTFNVLASLTQNLPRLRSSLLMGGRNRRKEEKELTRGAAVVVATPGRLLDHLLNSPDFLRQNLRVLIIDEADRIFSLGFEKVMRQILRLLPGHQRQTGFFSATLTEKVGGLAASAIRADRCVRVEVDSAAPELLQQLVVVCESHRRFDLVFNFLELFRRRKKGMIFMGSCLAVKFFAKLFEVVEVPVMAIHGQMDQSQRSSAFLRFCDAEAGALICTDVAARGLDIPDVHWIVQFDPPIDPRDYVHRVGRTARAGAAGRALLFLRPHERGFLKTLQQSGLTTQALDVRWERVRQMQGYLEASLRLCPDLAKLAVLAFKSYVRSYAAHHLKECFNVERLDLLATAGNFGLTEVPACDLQVFSSKKNRKRKERRRELEAKQRK